METALINKTLNEDVDAELTAACQVGNRAAFEALVVRHRERIVRHAYRLLGDWDRAESAAQEVTLRLFKSIESFRADAKFTSWLYRVTENVCFTMLEKEKRERQKVDAFGLTLESADIEDRLAEEAADFVELMRPLAEDERNLLALRFVQDRELLDIAVIMGTGLSATKMRLYRALGKVREHLATQDFESHA